MTTTTDTATKRCTKCETELPVGEFNRDRNTTDGLSTVCRGCNAEYCRAYRARGVKGRAPQIPEYPVTRHALSAQHAPSYAHTPDWRHRAACRDEDPELFFPTGNTGPALLQIQEAKAVCRRCPEMEACLEFALHTGQEAGVFGGMSEDERRALKRKAARNRARTTT